MFLLSVLVLMPAYADTVILLNGNTVEGKITEQTDKYIKLESSGITLTYYLDRIKSINRGNGLVDVKQASINERVNNNENNPIINSAKTEGIKVGKWSITMTTKLEGQSEIANAMNNLSPEMKETMKKYMPANTDISSQGFTTTMTLCITNQIPFPFGNDRKSCQETHKVNGNTVHYNVTCTMTALAGQETTDSNGYVTYNGDSLEGDATSQTNMINKHMNQTIHLTGKYLGICN